MPNLPPRRPTGSRGGPQRLGRAPADRALTARMTRLRSRCRLCRDRRAAAPADRPRRTAGRAEDRLHQPHHLAGIRRLCSDLGRHVRHHLARSRGEPDGIADLAPLARAADRAGDCFRFRDGAAAGMSECDLLDCVEWVSAWLRDRAVALPDLAVHGAGHRRRLWPARRLSVGPAHRFGQGRAAWVNKLANFEIELGLKTASSSIADCRRTCWTGHSSTLRHLLGPPLERYRPTRCSEPAKSSPPGPLPARFRGAGRNLADPSDWATDRRGFVAICLSYRASMSAAKRFSTSWSPALSAATAPSIEWSGEGGSAR